MKNFLKIIVLLAIIGIAIISLLLVLDIAALTEMKDVLQKFLLVLAILTLAGLAVDFLVPQRKS